MKTLVTFKSSQFNTSKPQDYFINQGCFGDDVAKSIIKQLKAKGTKVDEEPDQEDFGWYFNFELPEGKYCFVIGLRKDDSTWVGWVEKKRGLIASVFLGRKKGISQEATKLINEAITKLPAISNVSWHERSDFDKGIENLGTMNP